MCRRWHDMITPVARHDDRYRREGLWLLLVDLKQAFDSVHRGLLFTELEQAALPGRVPPDLAAQALCAHACLGEGRVGDRRPLRRAARRPAGRAHEPTADHLLFPGPAGGGAGGGPGQWAVQLDGQEVTCVLSPVGRRHHCAGHPDRDHGPVGAGPHRRVLPPEGPHPEPREDPACITLITGGARGQAGLLGGVWI